MSPRYRAMQIRRPGILELVERELPTPSADEVLIAVEACGVCGADANDIETADAALQPPRVPGHEVVGRVAAAGAAVGTRWTVGQRVGVGRLGGACLRCDACRRGALHACADQPITGATRDGGYAEMMLARASGLISIPEELDACAAAPILCAGIATFNALRKSGAAPGETVAVLGIGGLGHLAVQYAARMGYRVIAIGRGAEVGKAALALGAHRFIDTGHEDAAAILRQAGGAHAIVSTVRDATAVNPLIAALAPRGTLVLLGVPKDPLAVSAGLLVGGERRIIGSITGTPAETEQALGFSLLTGVRPMIEVLPLEQAQAAYERLKLGQPQFRLVLTPRRAD